MESIFGNISIYTYFVSYFFAFIGIILIKLIKLKYRKKKEPKLSIKYWLQDNFFELIINFILIFLAIRFTNQLKPLISEIFSDNIMKFINIDNAFFFLFLGLFHQTILNNIRQKTLIGNNIFKKKIL